MTDLVFSQYKFEAIINPVHANNWRPSSILIQRWHRYCPRLPELYSCCINSLIIPALKNTWLNTKVWNKLPSWFLIREFWYIFHFSKPFLPFLIKYVYLETHFHFPWSSFFLSEISWFQEISWKVAALLIEYLKHTFFAVGFRGPSRSIILEGQSSTMAHIPARDRLYTYMHFIHDWIHQSRNFTACIG